MTVPELSQEAGPRGPLRRGILQLPGVPAEGEPQRAAFRRLVEEPSAVARFVLDSLQGAPRAAVARGEF